MLPSKEVASALGSALHDPIKGFGILSDYAKRRVGQATGIGQVEMSKAHPAITEHARHLRNTHESLPRRQIESCASTAKTS